jgi:DNA-binding NarL/FixJ family response regulator
MRKKEQISIFIVEDNKVFTLTLKAEIEAAFIKIPLKIHSFVTGETCMLKFKEEKPQVVILDYHLNSRYPDAMDGIKVLDWIKEESPETSVIMLTSDDNVEIALKSFKHGASDYVVKSETKFRKINYSLFNLIKITEARNDAQRYKYMAFGLFLCIAFMVGIIIAIQI